MNKKIVIFLVIFVLLCIAITSGAVYFTLEDRKNKEIEEQAKAVKTNENSINLEMETIKEDPQLASELTDTYSTNAIKINQVQYGESDEEGNASTYVQIEGLKNEEVQAKVNSDIKTKFIEVSNANPLVTVNCLVQSNFANILSMTIEYWSDDEEFHVLPLNYRLDTGEQIQFEDLFTSKKYVKDILRTSMYNNYDMYSGPFIGETEDHSPTLQASNYDFSAVDDDVFKMINYYENGGEVKFYIERSTIKVEMLGKSFGIETKDFADKIAMYKRFQTSQSLYENDNLGIKNISVFSGRDFVSCLYYARQKVSDNLYVDIHIYDFDTEDVASNNATEDISDDVAVVKKMLEKIANKIGSDKNNVYVLTLSLSNYKEDGISENERAENWISNENMVLYKVMDDVRKANIERYLAECERERFDPEGVKSIWLVEDENDTGIERLTPQELEELIME